MVHSDLPRLPNPIPPICVIPATEPKFDLWIFQINLQARQQLPAMGCHASASLPLMVSIHQPLMHRIARLAFNLCLPPSRSRAM